MSQHYSTDLTEGWLSDLGFVWHANTQVFSKVVNDYLFTVWHASGWCVVIHGPIGKTPLAFAQDLKFCKGYIGINKNDICDMLTELLKDPVK